MGAALERDEEDLFTCRRKILKIHWTESVCESLRLAHLLPEKTGAWKVH